MVQTTDSEFLPTAKRMTLELRTIVTYHDRHATMSTEYEGLLPFSEGMRVRVPNTCIGGPAVLRKPEHDELTPGSYSIRPDGVCTEFYRNVPRGDAFVDVYARLVTFTRDDK